MPDFVPSAAHLQRAAAETAGEFARIVWRERRTECGGLVWGKIYRAPTGYVAWVAAMTPGVGRGTAATFEIAPASYIVAKRLLQAARFPEHLRELGMWHSHPGYGAWLSAVDEGSFQLCQPELWKVSIVVDPLQEEWGIFVKGTPGVRSIPGYAYDGSGFGAVPALDPYRAWQMVRDGVHD
jgi:proteasome lid subunit RPN8/RPN11